jgi:threonine synthase
MGAPITGFVAATNANKTIPDWVSTGEYVPHPSVQTFSNAMDVGAPSNFERIKSMYSLDEIKTFMAAYWLDDEGTLASIKQCFDEYGYLLDPHGAVGFSAWQAVKNGGFEKTGGGAEKPGLASNAPTWAGAVKRGGCVGLVLETAHPAKFGEVVQKACGKTPELPERLQKVLSLPDRAVAMKNDYGLFKTWLMDTHA